MNILKRAIATVAAAAAFASMQTAFADTYYWFGTADDSPLDSGKYHVSASESSEALAEIPAAGSDIYVIAGHAIAFDDNTAAYLAALARIQTVSSTQNPSYCIIDISTNVTVSTTFDHQTAGGNGNVVKRGAGTLSLTGVGERDYYTSFDVQDGDLVFPQSGQANGTRYYHAALSVAEGSTVYLDGGNSANAFILRCTKGISGNGDIAYTNDSAVCTLEVLGDETERFSGILSGSNLKLQVQGALLLDNTANTFGYGGSSGTLTFTSGTLGFRKLGNTSDASSSVGCLQSYITLSNNESTKTFLCLATEDDGAQTSEREIRRYGEDAIVFDGGAYGGFTYAGKYKVFHNRMNEIVLTGSNTAACVWYGHIITGTGYTGYEYLTKRGSGTWKMQGVPNNTAGASRMTALAGIGVENGTLEFGQVKEAGEMCSLGAAPADYLFGYALKDTIENVASSNKATYAIRLGNAADPSEEGTLEYVGTADGYCSTRTIGVAGNGRFKNSGKSGSTNRTLAWTGFKSIVPPEDAALVPELCTLTFDGSTGSGYATNITEDAGAAPLRIAKEGTATWTLGGDLAFTGGIDVREGTLNVGTMTTEIPYLRCDSGAELNFTGEAPTATGLYVDASAGIGAISNVAFGASGAVTIVNWPEGTDEIAVDAAFTDCQWLGRVAAWPVTIDGVSSRKIVKVSSDKITIASPGFMLIFK